MSKQAQNLDPAPCCVAAALDARFFRALSDPNRIALLNRLAACGRPCCVSELAECCPTDFSVTSRHLACLRDAGILDAEKCGKEVRYTVRFDELIRRLRTMADAVAACCPPGCCRETEENSNEDAP
jgi:ArsR family transcriptional regulator